MERFGRSHAKESKTGCARRARTETIFSGSFSVIRSCAIASKVQAGRCVAERVGLTVSRALACAGIQSGVGLTIPAKKAYPNLGKKSGIPNPGIPAILFCRY